MGIKKTGSNEVRKLTKVGGASLVVTIPRDIITKLGWKEKQKVVVKLNGKKLIISDWKPDSRNK